MKSNFEENKYFNNNEDNRNKNENDLKRLDSPNNTDSEANAILKQSNNIFIEKYNTTNVGKEIKKKFFLHDKEITEDSIKYFSEKLKKTNNFYKIILYICINIYILDIIIYIFNDDNILKNNFNLCSIILILLAVIYQAYIFKNNFTSISKKLYDFTIRIIYIYNIVGIIFLINILNIIIFQIKNRGKIIFEKNILDNTLFLFIYDVINFLLPIILSIKLFSLKKCIKNLSAAKGEIYESAKIEDVQIINSVIN